MAWSSLAGGSRLMSFALRNSLTREATVQLRQRRGYLPGGGKEPMHDPAVKEHMWKTALGFVNNGVKTFLKLDPEYKVITTVVPTVILFSFWNWNKAAYKEVPKQMNGHPVLIPQAAVISHINEVAANPISIPKPCMEKEPDDAKADAPFENASVVWTKNDGTFTNILDSKPCVANNEAHNPLLLPIEISQAVEPEEDTVAPDANEAKSPPTGKSRRRRRKRSKANKEDEVENEL